MPLNSSIFSKSRQASHAHAFETVAEEVLELIRGQIDRVEKVIDRGEKHIDQTEAVLELSTYNKCLNFECATIVNLFELSCTTAI